MPSPGEVIALAVVGILAGLVLLVRGMRAYLVGTRVADTASSTIEALAAGEVRVSGTVEPAEVLLVSPLQSRQCVWYRASVSESRGRNGSAHLLDEERAVGFRVRDATGAIRIFPRGARVDAPPAFSARSGVFGEEPPGLELRRGPAIDTAVPDRAAAIARLTTVDPGPGRDPLLDLGGRAGGAVSYREARIEPGDVVTVVGQAIPFGQIGDPDLADVSGDGLAADPQQDPEIAADLALAEASGTLASSPEAAWGNAAIPGFGIGRPTRTPALDPDARPEALATPAEAAETARRWTLSPDELVLASAPDEPLIVAAGAPALVSSRESDRFLLGLVGALLSIASAVVLAIVVGSR